MGGSNAPIPGIDLGNMDLSVSPKEDFYSFVNGSWMQNTTIPKELSSWGGFDVLKNATDKTILALLKELQASGKYASDSDETKALAIFNTAMDTL
jgi:putative endopeptidase